MQNPPTEEEAKFLHHEGSREGMKMWCTFNDLQNSSTRCEIGGTLATMMRPVAVNIGVDNKATVDKGGAIIEHQKQRREHELKEKDGALKLGGFYSPLHRQSPWKKAWQLMKDGDLWKAFSEAVASKTPTAVTLTKVKGHATQEMVADGSVRTEDKKGNDEADDAAEKGSTGEQPRIYHLAKMYSRRQGAYVKLMDRIHRFIINLKTAERQMRAEEAKKKDPFGKGLAEKSRSQHT